MMALQADGVTDFGGRLRQMREARGVTLREISAATNISVGQLEALERNEIARLPGGIFLRGILRSYARQIGADPELTVKEFTASVQGESIASEPPVHKTDYEKATTPRRSRRAIILAAGLVFLVGVLLWLRWRMT